MRAERPHSQAGMTMIEIMVVLAIMGVLMAMLLGTGLIKTNETRAREAAVEVMATLRGAYNMATMSGKHHRVVLNLEEQTYHIEICEGRQRLRKGDEEEQLDEDEMAELKERLERPPNSDVNEEIIQADSPEASMAAAAALQGINVGTSRCQPATKNLSGQPTSSGNKHKLDTDRGIRINRIHVQHLNDEIEEGVASINFFPVGSAEKAVVEVENEDDAVFSVLLHGLTSRTEFRVGKVEAKDHMTLNAEGDDVDEREDNEE